MTKPEMKRAVALGAALIGINNRDLRDLSIDLATTERLARLAPGRILVSESGIESRADVERLAPEVDGFLVGSSLMRAPSPAEAARALVFGRTKLCGLNRAEDFAAASRATHVGLVMVPESPRAVTLGEALRLAPLHPAPVGVFRNASVETVAEAAMMMGLVAVQLHGAEDAAYVRKLARRLPADCEIWKAVAVGRSPPERFDAADRLLFDNGVGRDRPDVRLDAAPRSPRAGRRHRRRRDRSAQCPRGAPARRFCDRRRLGAGCSARAQVGGQDRGAVRRASFPLSRPAHGMRLTGRFGRFGGCFAPEILVPALEQLEAAFLDSQDDPAFAAELNGLLANFAGRPTPLTRCRNLPGNIYLKREDLLHGGAHKTNQVLAQGLLAKRMGKTRLIAETGAGQHGVATAIVGALLGFETVVYMGAEDVERQRLNVFRMELMGARVIPVESGGRTLKDAINEALRDWSASFEGTHYLLGTAAGPHPFPTMVREFQRVIGREARAQIHRAARPPP